MFWMQHLPGSSVAVLSVGLFLGGWAQSESAGGEQTKLTGGDIAKAMSNPQDAAAINFIASRLPGSENVWYVVVLRGTNGNAKSFQVALASGKTAAAFQIVEFLKRNPKIARNPQSYSRWLYLEMYPNQQLAGLRCQAISNFAWQKGYR